MPHSVTYVTYNEKPSSNPELTAFYAGTEEPLEPGYVSGPIIRDCYIMQYCHTGKGVLTVNTKSFDISAGQCFMLFPGSVVTLTTDVHEPWGKSWVCLYGTKIAYYLKNIGITEDSPVFAWSEKPEILEEIHKCISYVSGRSIPNEFDQKICANKLFKLLIDTCSPDSSASQSAQVQSEYINRALQFIGYNFRRRISVNDISTHLGLNRTYFSTLFKERMKISPQEYILKRRIEKACDFFANPNSTVTSVAYSLGYEPHVFTRLFKNTWASRPPNTRTASKTQIKKAEF